MFFRKITVIIVLSLLFLVSGAQQNAEKQPVWKPITVYYGSDLDFMPYEFRDETGRPVGFDIELIKEIGRLTNMKVVIRYDKWNNLRKRLETKDGIDIIVMSDTELSKKKVDISLPVSVLNYVVYTRRNSPSINSLEELRGKKIIVLKGDFVDDFLIEKGFQQEMVYVDSWSEVLTTLNDGKYDCGVIALSYASRFIKQHNLKNIRSSGAPIYYDEFGFSVAEGRSQLLERINKGLIMAKDNGAYDELYTKWVLRQGQKSPVFQYVSENWKWLLFAIMSVVIFITFWSWSLKRLVNRRTFELEKELMARKRTEKMLFKKTQELYGVVYKQSHNLRGPITSIMGVLNLTEYDVEEPRARKYFRLIRKQVSCLEEAIRNFSFLNKLQEKETISRIDFQKVVEKSLKKLSGLPGFFRLRIICEIEPVANFFADEQLLVLMFEKLIENAIQFRKKHAEDSYLLIKVCDFPEMEELNVVLKDNGQGIDKKMQNKVFDMFYRGHERSQGSGLGLYLVKNAVEKMEGTIELKSVEGKGTTVEIRLPKLY